jgi:tryptophanyl-tRNA synthetase
LSDVNAGLFVYPVLMAADIILYDADIVPVGKDQVQHLEITRDIAETFNRQMGETFVVPQVQLSENTMYIPGTDGQKMSKSYNNFINIFLPEKELKDVINKKIITDTTPLEEPKDAENSIVYKLFKLVATPESAAEMKSKLEAGGYGWGHAKKELYETILTTYSKEREIFNHYMSKPEELEERLLAGAAKARITAQKTLTRVRESLGY